jgi:predicted MFS family arabinose efflux permease
VNQHPPSAELELSSPEPAAGRRSFYGWRIVSASFLVQFLTMGTTFYAFGVLLKPLAEDLDASRFAVGSALPMMMLVGALVGPPLGRAIDRRGARGLMLLGVAFMTAGFLALARSNSLFGLYASFGGLVSLGVALLGPLPNTALVANWFQRARGTALGISQIGISLSGMFMAYATTWLVLEYGWRTTILCFSMVPILLVAPIVALVIVNRPQDRGLLPDGDVRAGESPVPESPPEQGSLRDALRERDLWLIALVMGLNFAGSGSVIQVIHSHTTDLGHSATRAATALSLMAGMAALGKPVFGTLSDRISPRSSMALATGLQLAGLLAILLSSGYASLLAASMLFGLGFGGLLPLFGLLIAARFGAGSLARMMGAAGPVMLPFQLLGLPFATAVFDRSGSYAPAFLTFLAFYVVALAILSRLPGDSVEA